MIAAAILIGLTLWCAVYAYILHTLHNRYVPDWIIVTVAIGDLWVLIAYGALNAAGYHGAWPWLFLCFLAAGIPIGIWQAIQYHQRHTARLQRKAKDAHGTAHKERTPDLEPDRRSP